MKAVVLNETGAADRLAYEDVAEPTPGDREVVLDVRAAGVNFADVLVRRGQYPQMPALPTVLGSEVAGELSGRRVIGFASGGGGYAERVAVDEEWLLPLPERATFAEGAAFPMAFLTAWIPLTELVRVAFRSRVLVTAAAGAVGSAAIQLVRALNGTPVAAVGSEAKRDFALSHGAEEAVTYEALDEVAPVAVVFDLVGGEVLERALGLVRPLGTAIAAGYAGGSWRSIDPTWLVGRNIGLHGFYLGRLMRHDPGLVRRAAEDVLRLWEAGAVRPIVGAEYPLEDAAQAHRLVEERRSVGKVVLVP